MFYNRSNAAMTTKLGKDITPTEDQRTRGIGYLRVSTDGQAQEGLKGSISMLYARQADALLIVKLDRLMRSVRDLPQLRQPLY